ncbi:MAG TPA: FHA domain-containing protein [Ktedonobacterales bacterium]|nr:FHA domain-containing protein [Ktedonobacterales bacterium]
MYATLRGPFGLIHLDQAVLTIGRSRQNRLAFTHRQISARHAEIHPLGNGRFQMIDVGSTNGTSVNGLRLTAGTPYPLGDGDTLLLGGPGGIALVFAYSAAPAQAAPPQPDPLTTDHESREPTHPSGRHAPPPIAVPAAVLPGPPPPAPAPWPVLGQGGPPVPPLPAQVPGGPISSAGQDWPPVAFPPAPLPAAISTTARYKHPPLIALLGGGLLVLVLVVAGIGLGGKLLGRSTPRPTAPVVVNTRPPTPTPASAVIQTASVTVQGQATTVLTTTQGQTLYYFTPDTATTTACTGTCIAKWPPLLFQGAGTPTAATALPGTLSVQQTANGAQVEYNGHFLYTFSGDTAPGQVNGQGKGGKWFVATPQLSDQN